MHVGEVGKALRHETLSAAGSASTKRTILGDPGPEFTVTAQFSFSPRENPTEMPSMTLLWHLEVQRVKERVCFEPSTWSPLARARQLKQLPYSQAGEGGKRILGCPFRVRKPLQLLYLLPP